MISIRSARQDEAATLAEIGLRAWEAALRDIDDSSVLRQAAEAAFRAFTADHWLTISVVEEDGVIAGWAARERLDETITDFWIDPLWHRRGLGTALLTSLEADIRHQGFDTARLETHARNSAVAFFERHGYVVHWLTVSYSPKLDRDVETVGLSKLLDEGEGAGLYGPGATLQ
ncbi:GNAT family N-acetyltransferase [Rhizobiaceae bacterium BDR2-2]|uniref:GNAT family N-acetyltransferase n=1 Tax=Ectorhizobium quercum TaxID=2965071 RepID=A0AAE3N0R2_9HYPH|nr:GNAT family N-acetyltransferase [Ectorhizobium quercum]MCX8998883.1 GNAT family N-acetyltransferase [Ectorhizobium quercum]